MVYTSTKQTLCWSTGIKASSDDPKVYYTVQICHPQSSMRGDHLTLNTYYWNGRIFINKLKKVHCKKLSELLRKVLKIVVMVTSLVNRYLLESYLQGDRAHTVQGQAGNGLQILVNEAIYQDQDQAFGVWVMFIMVITIEVNVNNCDNGIVEFQPYFHIKSL